MPVLGEVMRDQFGDVGVIFNDKDSTHALGSLGSNVPNLMSCFAKQLSPGGDTGS